MYSIAFISNYHYSSYRVLPIIEFTQTENVYE